MDRETLKPDGWERISREDLIALVSALRDEVYATREQEYEQRARADREAAARQEAERDAKMWQDSHANVSGYVGELLAERDRLRAELAALRG